MVLAILLAPPVAFACDSGTVRDAALMAERAIYRLCVFVKSDDAGADDEIKRIESRISDPAAKLNMQVERVDVDKPGVDWESYGIPSAPPETPVAALIGEGGMPKRAFVLDHWQPYPTDDDLGAIKTSPAREKIKDGIASHWAVVLYSPGDPALGADGARPDELFKEVETEWAEKQSPGVTTVQFDRADPAERMLRSFTGIEKEGPAWAGIVFGRGKVLAPPLTGSGITKENIGKLLEGLAIPCTCLQESSVLGLDIPMTWDARLDEVVAALKPTGGYFETMLDPAGQSAPMAVVPQPGRQVLGIALAAAIAVALVAVTATGVVVYRARRGAA
ncbi:MAG TPA: hypothetical protein VMZ06_01390 [Candidatus Bathyarchaeia archaeon]|nr:hypothetical protein [Candidatus Bathyarchaeia archaeon]